MTTTRTSDLLTEAAWHLQVVSYAKWRGWLVWHDVDSRRNEAGLPDLLLLRDDRLVVAELKSQAGRVRPPQARWLAAFTAAVPETFVWRPSDWPEVERVLR